MMSIRYDFENTPFHIDETKSKERNPCLARISFLGNSCLYIIFKLINPVLNAIFSLETIFEGKTQISWENCRERPVYNRFVLDILPLSPLF